MRKRPPCPGDPRDYVWVESKERPHWRRKRGSVSEAALNEAYLESSKKTKVVSPAAKSVRNSLAPYLAGLTPGRLNNRISNAFRKSLKERSRLRLAYLTDIEIQRDFPLDGMLLCNYKVHVDEKKVRIEIPVEQGCIRTFNTLVSDYYFEAVLLYGDVSKERGLDTVSCESALYSIHSMAKIVCLMEVALPEHEDWCLFLKINSLEGNEMAAHTKHYRMKVIAARSIG